MTTAMDLASSGVRFGRLVVGVSLLPARAGWDATRRQLQARGEAAFDDMLAGPLTEHVTRSLAAHRIVERVADELVANGTVAALLDQALESRLLIEMTDRVLASDEMQHLIAHIASSPELRTAIAEQSSGLAEEMVAGVRQRTASLDDVAERTVRGWLRRPRPLPT